MEVVVLRMNPTAVRTLIWVAHGDSAGGLAYTHVSVPQNTSYLPNVKA